MTCLSAIECTYNTLLLITTANGKAQNAEEGLNGASLES